MRAALLLAVVVLGLAACGGGGGGGGRMTADELVQRADTICGDYEDAIAGLTLPQSIDDLATLAVYSAKAHDALDDSLVKLRKLQPPASEEQVYRDWLAAGDRALARIQQVASAAKRGDRRAIQELSAAPNTDRATSNRLARQLGFKVCPSE